MLLTRGAQPNTEIRQCLMLLFDQALQAIALFGFRTVSMLTGNLGAKPGALKVSIPNNALIDKGKRLPL